MCRGFLVVFNVLACSWLGACVSGCSAPSAKTQEFDQQTWERHNEEARIAAIQISYRYRTVEQIEKLADRYAEVSIEREPHGFSCRTWFNRDRRCFGKTVAEAVEKCFFQELGLPPKPSVGGGFIWTPEAERDYRIAAEHDRRLYGDLERAQRCSQEKP